MALLCSGVAWASLPRPAELRSDEQMQWQALGIAPLSNGGATGLRMAATESVEPLDFAPHRAVAVEPVPSPETAAPAATGPLRIRGRVGDGLYWSLRAAGASPDVAAQYLAALATEIDVGEVAPGDSFDLVLGGGNLLYAGLSRAAAQPMQLVRWTAGGQAKWIDAAASDSAAPVVSSGMIMPVDGPDHLLFRLSLSPDPALHPLPRWR